MRPRSIDRPARRFAAVLCACLAVAALAAPAIARRKSDAEGPAAGDAAEGKGDKEGKAKKPKKEAPPPGEVFYPAPLLRIRIELPQEGYMALASSPRNFVRGTIREGNETYTDVGVRLKGSIGSSQPITSKPGFCLKFDKFVKKGRFHGLKKLLLDNSVQDPTYLNELIGNEIFRAAGVPAPRNNHAVVTLNGRKLGLYVVTEAVTHDFLARWFRDASGNLYEGPGDITKPNLDVDSHGGASDRSDLKELAEACKERSSALRLEKVGKLLDIERFLSFAAVEAITCHWDGYVSGKNNFHLYHDPSSGHFVFIPHGTDQLFQNPGYPIMPQSTAIVAQAILKTAVGRRQYRERLKTLVDTVFDPDAIDKKVQEVLARIKPYVQEGGFAGLFRHAMTSQDFTRRVADRARNIRDQLAGNVVSMPLQPVGPALAFDANGIARFRGWSQQMMGSGAPEFQQLAGKGEHGGSVLATVIRSGTDCRASWRKTVFLPPGRYVFSGRVRCQGVVPSGGTMLNDTSLGGVDLRISGDQPAKKLVGDSGWTDSSFEFEIEAEEDLQGPQPVNKVTLVCELQASRGAAWFDEGSLQLRRMPDASRGTAPRERNAGRLVEKPAGAGPAGPAATPSGRRFADPTGDPSDPMPLDPPAVARPMPQ